MCLAMPGRVESIQDDRGTPMGRVNFGGAVKDVCLAYVPGIAVGDYAIVHVGFAIARVDEASALETLLTFAALEIPGADGADPESGEAEVGLVDHPPSPYLSVQRPNAGSVSPDGGEGP